MGLYQHQIVNRRSDMKVRGCKTDCLVIHRAGFLYIFLPVLLMSLLLVQPLAAAENSDTNSDAERPKIGVVLGGGGARGAAHVGVLKILEDLRIPVDFIVGTSMGSIVAGLSATGMSSEEIRQAMITMDWNDVFDDNPPRADRSFRRKRDDDLYTIDASLGCS